MRGEAVSEGVPLDFPEPGLLAGPNHRVAAHLVRETRAVLFALLVRAGVSNEVTVHNVDLAKALGMDVKKLTAQTLGGRDC